MSDGARVFVRLIFILLGGSFIVTTGALYFEYGLKSPEVGTALATYYSHLFIFFPTFGLLALIAFFVPATVLVDMYWTYVPNGKYRLSIGFLVMVVLALAGGNMIGGGDGLKSMFEIKPAVLEADTGEPKACDVASGNCLRAPILKSLGDVRNQSTRRAGMSQFVRDCAPDPLIDSHPDRALRRHCFVTLSLQDADACCQAQERFAQAISKMHDVADNRSFTGWAHRLLLPFKVFFMLMVLTLAILLVLRHQLLEEHYGVYMKKIQRGVLIGAFAMLVWPLMNLAFLQSSGLLYGTGHESAYRDASPGILIMYVLWALLVVFFFFKSFDKADKDMENMGRIAGIVGSAVAASNYQTIIDWAVRISGSGATVSTLGTLLVITVGAMIAIVLQPKRSSSGRITVDK